MAEVFESAAPGLEGLQVKLHEAIRGTDGSYDFDATIGRMPTSLAASATDPPAET